MIGSVTYEDVVVAARRIAPYVHFTPVFTSKYLDEVSGATVFLKAENFQKVGAFKARGAVNAVLSLSDTEALSGVVTHSSGNHGQAVAYACAIRNIPATIVMPDHAPQVKVDAVIGYGARVVFCPQSERQQALDEVVAASHATVVHPFDDPAVIAGQGTAHRGIVAVGAEPEIVDDSYRSLRDGIRYPATGAVSVGDGLLTGIGELPFRILSEAGTKILTVSESEITEAMRTVAERTKLVVEPSGATAVAALLRHNDRFSGQRVGIILSGGNVELSRFSVIS
jgi:threonine dehydratase